MANNAHDWDPLLQSHPVGTLEEIKHNSALPNITIK